MSGSSKDLRGPFTTIALACAIVAAASVALPWATGFRWSERGYQQAEGMILLVAAVNAILATAIARWDDVDKTSYARWAAPSGIAMLAAAVWFRVTVIGYADPAFEHTMIDCFTYPCDVIHAGYGLSLAILASAGYLVALALTFTSPLKPQGSPASAWPISPPTQP
ncbi:MAG TPA: hypothetical protein VFH62_00450 [Dehalococcoidia bacterium]|jgi:hypothetical protein|nr:hypothetical protein [Dehalococcoidia bacterium]